MADYNILFTAQDKASPAMQRVQKNLGGVDKSSVSARKGLGGVVNSLTSMVNPATLATGAITGLAAAVVGSAARFVDVAREARHLSTTLGISVEAVSELTYAWQSVGLEGDDVLGLMNELNIRIRDAARGTGPAVEGFEALGISMQELNDLNTDQVLQRVTEELENIADPAERAFLADAVFGGDAEKALRLLNQGSDALANLRQEARDSGAVITEQAAAEAERFESGVRRIEGLLGGIATSAGRAGVGVATSFLEAIGVIPASAETTASEAKTRFTTGLSGLVSETGDLGEQAGINFAQRFVRQIENAVAGARITLADLYDYDAPRRAESIERTRREYLLGTGRYVPSLDGPVPRRDTNLNDPYVAALQQSRGPATFQGTYLNPYSASQGLGGLQSQVHPNTITRQNLEAAVAASFRAQIRTQDNAYNPTFVDPSRNLSQSVSGFLPGDTQGRSAHDVNFAIADALATPILAALESHAFNGRIHNEFTRIFLEAALSGARGANEVLTYFEHVPRSPFGDQASIIRNAGQTPSIQFADFQAETSLDAPNIPITPGNPLPVDLPPDLRGPSGGISIDGQSLLDASRRNPMSVRIAGVTGVGNEAQTADFQFTPDGQLRNQALGDYLESLNVFGVV